MILSIEQGSIDAGYRLKIRNTSAFSYPNRALSPGRRTLRRNDPRKATEVRREPRRNSGFLTPFPYSNVRTDVGRSTKRGHVAMLSGKEKRKLTKKKKKKIDRTRWRSIFRTCGRKIERKFSNVSHRGTKPCTANE